jgi:LexA DNA binding domain
VVIACGLQSYRFRLQPSPAARVRVAHYSFRVRSSIRPISTPCGFSHEGLRLFAILERMGKPVTLLERLCGHAMSFGAQSFETERKDGRQRAFAQIDGARTRIANFEESSADAKELRANLHATAKKSARTVIRGKVYILHVRVCESPGEEAFEVSLVPAPKLDPLAAPQFTAKQGQYLAFIYNYNKIHRCAPAESDLERYFRVSPPAIHDMIKTLERNGLIERTPGQARSIRLLVRPEHLPRLG